MPDPQTRQVRLAEMFTALAKTTAAASGVAETTTGLEAVAFWLRPGRDIGWRAMVKTGMVMARFTMTLPGEDRRRMMAVLRQLDQRRKQLMAGPHWYLTAIGVEPERQGQGFGSALVRSGMTRADREVAPIYLETETQDNVGYYQHLGFDVIEQTVARGLGLPIWLMIYHPGTSNNETTPLMVPLDQRPLRDLRRHCTCRVILWRRARHCLNPRGNRRRNHATCSTS